MKIKRITNALEKNEKGKSKARPYPVPQLPPLTPAASFWNCIRLRWWTILECKMVLSFTKRDRTKSGKPSVCTGGAKYEGMLAFSVVVFETIT